MNDMTSTVAQAHVMHEYRGCRHLKESTQEKSSLLIFNCDAKHREQFEPQSLT